MLNLVSKELETVFQWCFPRSVYSGSMILLSNKELSLSFSGIEQRNYYFTFESFKNIPWIKYYFSGVTPNSQSSLSLPYWNYCTILFYSYHILSNFIHIIGYTFTKSYRVKIMPTTPLLYNWETLTWIGIMIRLKRTTFFSLMQSRINGLNKVK